MFATTGTTVAAAQSRAHPADPAANEIEKRREGCREM